MPRQIDFYFDFGSPFAYFSVGSLERIAADHNCTVVWTPILLWAVRKHFQMTPPMEDGAKAHYMLADIERSAAFHGVPYKTPDSFGKSSHLAARLFYGLDGSDRRIPFVKAVFAAHFAESADIADPGTLAGIAQDCGIDRDKATALATAQSSKDALAAATQRAIDDRVWGSPYFILDGESFFGADRLPQLEWRLSGGKAA